MGDDKPSPLKLSYGQRPRYRLSWRTIVTVTIPLVIATVLIIFEPTVHSTEYQVDRMTGSTRERSEYLGLFTSRWKVTTSDYESELNKRGIVSTPVWIFESDSFTTVLGGRGCACGVSSPWLHIPGKLDTKSLTDSQILFINKAAAANDQGALESILKLLSDPQ